MDPASFVQRSAPVTVLRTPTTFYKQCSRGNLKTTNPVPVLIVRTVDEVSYQLGGLLRLLIPAHLVCRWELDRIFRNLV